MTAGPTSSDPVALAQLLGADQVDLDPLTSGTSRQTAAVRLRRGGDVEELIIQQHAAGDERLRMTPALEADVLRAARIAGVPVPPVVAASDDPALIGLPFVLTERVPGESIPRRILRDPDLAGARRGLAFQLGEILGRIHTVNLSDVPELERHDALTEVRTEADDLGLARPVMELAFQWLDRHRPPPSTPVLVHGDFRLGNVLVDPSGVTAVLDWELAHVGEAGEDLGWLCVPSWRFGQPLSVGGVGRTEDLLAGYATSGPGPAPDPEALHWWTVLGTLRWGVICGRQVQAFMDGGVISHELAAIGRRISETESDLLALLGPPGPPEAPAVTTVPPGLDRPDVDGLFAALDSWVADVADAASGKARYDARVARTVLGILRREAALGPGLAAERTQLLTPFGMATEEELAAALRRGDLDAHTPGLIEALRRMTAGRMAVNDPRYRGAWESA